MKKQGEKIVVGMSGGVDSSMALALLKEQGWDVAGVSLKLPVWKSCNNILKENVCCTQESLSLAEKVCKKLKVPYYVFDAKKEFKNKVVDYFLAEFSKNNTPNPCVVCNQKLKFP